MASHDEALPLQKLENGKKMERKDSETITSLCQNTSILLPLLNNELYNACASKDVESVRSILAAEAYDNDIVSPEQIQHMKNYYLLVDFLFNNLEINHHDSLFSLIMESIIGDTVTYEDACCSLLVIAVKQDYSNILDNLMKCRYVFDIDAKDSTGNTALHYAVQEDGALERTLAKILIRNGASMNVKNKEGICAIERIHPNTIEDILNECLDESNASNDRRDENYELKMDFRIFSHKESLENKSESEFVEALENSEFHRHFLYHPLVASFLHIKWQKIKVIWYLNIMFNLFFYLLILLYMCLYWNELLNNANTICLQIVITILGLILMAREIAQMKMFKWNYFSSFDNKLELSILLLTFIMIYIKEYYLEYHKSISAWLVVLITVEFLLLVEKMHLLKWSLYISMFRKITYNFAKLTLILLTMVMSFAISFNLLIHIAPDSTKEANNQTSIDKGDNRQSSKEDEKDPFADTLLKGILKTLVMATGEFDYDSLDFVDFPASSLLFAMFVFAIFLVAMNLLNGIAITDIQVIQNSASNYHVRDQVECIINFDKIRPMYSWFLQYSYLHFLDIGKFGPIFRRCLPDKCITLKPNRHCSTVSVICEGHEQFFYTNRYNLYFIRLLDFISCGTCGDIENYCQGCRENVPQNQHECTYKHHYIIPPKIITDVKQIKEHSEEEKESCRKEEDRTRMIKLEKLIVEDRTRMINMEQLIVDMQIQISKLNGEIVRQDSYC